MSRARKSFPKASEEYIEFADAFLEKSEAFTYTEEEFWSLVERCRDRLDAIPVDRYVAHEYQVFDAELRKLSTEQLFRAGQYAGRMEEKLYRREIWSAITYIDDICSDSFFQDFRQWLMTCGEEACNQMLRDPDNLPAIMKRYMRNIPYAEGVFIYPIRDEFEERTGYDPPFEDTDWQLPDFGLKGEWIEAALIPLKLPNCFRFKLYAEPG